MAHVTFDQGDYRSENIIVRFFSAIGHALVAMAESNPRVKQAQALSELSDAELAKRGLKREEIARQVFGDWI